jgi:hypothetical protein
MSDFDDYKADKHDFEKFQKTERDRERARQVAYQASLGPTKTWREIEIAELDRWDALWNRTTRGY